MKKIILAVLVLIVLVAGTVIIFRPTTLSTRELAEFKMPTGGDFTIHSTEGLLDSKSLRGKVVFIFFGFTHCPQVCPLTLSNLNSMIRDLPESIRPQVQVLYISVDPERDTLDVLKKHLSYFNAGNFIGASDTDENLRKITSLFGARYSRIEDESKTPFIDHTNQVFVINTRGEWVETLDYKVPSEEYKQAFATADEKKPIAARLHRLTDVQVIGENTDCDLSNGTCSAEDSKGQSFALSLSPQPIREGETIKIQALSGSQEWIPLLVDVEGVEQDMGFIRPELSPSTRGLYTGEFSIPYCETQEMHWKVRLVLHNKDNRFAVINFHMRTKR